MASADFSQFAVATDFNFSFHLLVRPPRVRVTAFPSCVRQIYCMRFGQYGTSLCFASSSGASQPIFGDMCSSDQGFASGFLQIPPHDGHPCLWLVVPTAKPTADFHRLAVSHAGHTKEARNFASAPLFVLISYCVCAPINRPDLKWPWTF